MKGIDTERKSGLPFGANHTDPLSLRPQGLELTALPSDRGAARPERSDSASGSPLGEPLNIRQVASLIGCSVWSVRQTLVPKGLPYFRSRPSGRLIFYRDQVVRWILENQIQERRTYR